LYGGWAGTAVLPIEDRTVNEARVGADARAAAGIDGEDDELVVGGEMVAVLDVPVFARTRPVDLDMLRSGPRGRLSDGKERLSGAGEHGDRIFVAIGDGVHVLF